MIDFRYHLISIVAVLLALSIGIVAGSGFLGGPLLDVLESRVTRLEETNGQLQRQLDESDDSATQQQAALDALEPFVVEGALTGRNVVLFELDGSDESIEEATTDAIEGAEGNVVSRISLSVDLRLDDDGRRAELAELLDTAGGSADRLRADFARVVGSRAAAAAEAPFPGVPASETVQARLEEMLGDLAAAGYVALDSDGDSPLVPPGAAFVVAGGSEEAAPYAIGGFVASLGTELAEDGAPAMVAEVSDSAWGLVSAVREDDDIEDTVSTVDHGDTPQGRIAIALGLAGAGQRPVEHYGFDSGADAVLPDPSAATDG